MPILWQLFRDGEASPAARLKRVAGFLAVPAVSAIAWFGFFLVVYGTADPRAPYGDSPDTRFAYVPGGVLALLFDQQFGLLTYSPVLAAAAAGLAFRRREPADRSILALAAVSLVYLAAVATYWMWWGGVPATPARFGAAILPALAAPLAIGWRRSAPGLRAIWNLLLVISAGLTILLVGVDRGALAWNVRGPRAAWLEWPGAIADLARGWPSFFWRLTPGDVSTEGHFALHVAILDRRVWSCGVGRAATRATGRPRRGQRPTRRDLGPARRCDGRRRLWLAAQRHPRHKPGAIPTAGARRHPLGPRGSPDLRSRSGGSLMAAEACASSPQDPTPMMGRASCGLRSRRCRRGPMRCESSSAVREAARSRFVSAVPPSPGARLPWTGCLTRRSRSHCRPVRPCCRSSRTRCSLRRPTASSSRRCHWTSPWRGTQ